MAVIQEAGVSRSVTQYLQNNDTDIIREPLDIGGQTLPPDFINEPYPLHYCLEQVIFKGLTAEQIKSNNDGVTANAFALAYSVFNSPYSNDVVNITKAIFYYCTSVPNSPRYVPTAINQSQHLTAWQWLDFLTYADGMLPNAFYYSIPYVREFLRLIGYYDTKTWNNDQYKNWYMKLAGAKLTADELLATASKVNPVVKAIVTTVLVIGLVPPVLEAAGFQDAADSVTDIYGRIGDSLTDGITKIKDDIVDDVFNVKVFSDLISDVVTDNVRNELNIVRHELNDYIQGITDKTGIDLSAVNEKWQDFTGIMVKDITATMANTTKSVVDSIVNHKTATEEALGKAQGQVWDNMILLNRETGLAVSEGLYNMIFEKVKA